MTRILVVGCWDDGPGYPRTDALIGALVAAGHDVEECRVAPPALRGSKSELISRPWRWPGWWLAARRSRSHVRAAVRAAGARGTVDAVLVPYPGHVAVRWVRSCYSGPVVLDLFLSAYGTAIEDRGLFAPDSIPARALARLDRRACGAADLVLLDTEAHAEAVRELTGLPASRFDWLPVSDPEPVHPTPAPARSAAEPLRLLFFGTGVPLHGLDTWIDAVERAPSVHLELYGGDLTARARATERLGARVTVRPMFVPMAELRAAIDRSHVVAGIFGRSDKAQRVIPFKAVHAMAHGRAVVTADSVAVRAMLEPGIDCAVAPAGEPTRLAALLEELAGDPARVAALGVAARRRYDTSFSAEAVTRRLASLLATRLGVGRECEVVGRLPELATTG